MDFGVYKSFIAEDEEEGVINILKGLESRTDVKSVKIKSGNAKTVIYIIMSDDRFNELMQEIAITERIDNSNTDMIDAIETKKEIQKAHSNIIKTKYYEKMSEKYKKYLGVK